MSDVSAWIRAVPGILAAAVGLSAAVVWQRRTRVGLSTQLIGGAVWAGSVALKFAWALPMNGVIHRALKALVGARLAEPLFWLYVGLLTGIFEVGATLAVVRFTRLRRAAPAETIAFGVGFGATEAIVLGVLSIVPVALMILAPGILPHDAKEALTRAYSGPITAAAMVFPPLERASTIVFHVVSCALVVHGFRVGRPLAWFGVAFAYKSAVDAVAAWGIMSLGVTSSAPKLAALEVGLAAFAVASGWALLYVLRTNSGPPRAALASPIASAG